uniref:50S ribosomal protein L19, chloroplastic n=2 Tax=Kalanchoe fedtschenkoi TaxID=63787 RepID=A0A7N0VKA6_KALFE
MASKVLPQAMVMLPRSDGPKKLGFPVASASVSWNRASVSRVKVVSKGLNFKPVVASQARRSILARAEAEEGAGAGAAEEEGVVSEGAGEESEPGAVEAKAPRTPRVKLGDVMGILNKKAIEASDALRPIPDLRTGDIVEIKLEVPENKRRLSIYKGIVISRQNAGIHTTVRIRRIIAGVGVEIVFPIYSPNIKEIKLVKHRKVRRARLYYLRDKLPRLSTFK